MLRLWTALFTVLLLSGCVLGPTGSSGDFTVIAPGGNGEGYGGNREKVIRTAYQVDSDFRCTDGAAPGYQSKIEVRADESMVVRDGCGGEPRLISEQPDVLGQKLLGYGTGIYEFRESAPSASADEPYVVAWCGVIGRPAELGYLMLSTTQTKARRAVVYQKENGVLDFTDPFQYRTWLVGMTRVFVSEPLEAAVLITPDSLRKNFFLGKMRFDGEQSSTACRLVLKAL